MRLNGQSGSIATGSGFAPAGASQCAKASVSSRVSGIASPDVTPAPSSAACASPSTNHRRAPASVAIATSCGGVADGASGAAASPARSAPRNTPRYSTLGEIGRGTRLNSSHHSTSYAVFCLKKKKKNYSPRYKTKRNDEDTQPTKSLAQ